MANILGTLTLNEREILEVDDVPSTGAGTPASVGSICVNIQTGYWYQKTGEANTQWDALDNFSYKKIFPGEFVEVPDGQQMFVDDDIDIEGELEINGEMVLVTAGGDNLTFPDNFSYNFIEANTVVQIPSDQQMICDEYTDIEGELDIEGEFIVLPLGFTVDDVPVPPAPIVYPENFSYNFVAPSVTVQIPQHQEMLTGDGIDIEGVLDIEGTLDNIGEYEEPLNWFFVPSTQSIRIGPHQQYLLDDGFDLEGLIDIEGELVINGG